MYRYKVSCFGAGFVGIPTSTVLALKNPDKQVPPMKLSSLSTISMRPAFSCVNRTSHTSMSKDLSMWWNRPMVRTYPLPPTSPQDFLRPQWFFWHCQLLPKLLDWIKARLMTFPTQRWLSGISWLSSMKTLWKTEWFWWKNQQCQLEQLRWSAKSLRKCQSRRTLRNTSSQAILSFWQREPQFLIYWTQTESWLVISQKKKLNS